MQAFFYNKNRVKPFIFQGFFPFSRIADK